MCFYFIFWLYRNFRVKEGSVGSKIRLTNGAVILQKWCWKLIEWLQNGIPRRIYSDLFLKIFLMAQCCSKFYFVHLFLQRTGIEFAEQSILSSKEGGTITSFGGKINLRFTESFEAHYSRSCQQKINSGKRCRCKHGYIWG